MLWVGPRTDHSTVLCPKVLQKETTCPMRCREPRRSTGYSGPKEPQRPTMWSLTSTTRRPTWAALWSWRAPKTTLTCRWWTTSRWRREKGNRRVHVSVAMKLQAAQMFNKWCFSEKKTPLVKHLTSEWSCLSKSQYFTSRPVNLCKWYVNGFTYKCWTVNHPNHPEDLTPPLESFSISIRACSGPIHLNVLWHI